MPAYTKILSLAVATSILTLATLCAYGQIKLKDAKTKHPHNKGVTLGFQSGRELLFNSSPLLHSRQGKVHTGISSSLVLRKPLSGHFKVEGGISYSILQNAATAFNEQHIGNKYTITTQKPYSVALPVTIQYFFLPEHCRVRPYFGAGLQYNLNIAGGNAISPFTNNDAHTTDDQAYNQQPGTKYISILFTQGITFQVNTKIQVNQSFHFIPDNANKVIGIDLGIGYQLP